MSTTEIETRGLPGPGDLVAGKYRIEKVLGAGAMGVVVSALHVDLAQPVAIKFLRPEILFDSSSIARFMREARVAASIRSEHVVRIHDVAKLESGTPYLVMEHLSGMDLDELLSRRGPLPPAELADYMLQACAAVAEVHAAGIVHRDLKPGNLFITRRGDGSPLVKVLDFGISKFLPNQLDPGAPPDPSLTADGQFIGSVHYMSPEQLQNPKRADLRSDVWAFGVIMYKLTAGRHAFHADTVVGCIDAIMNATPAPLSGLRKDVTAEFDQVILRCLEKDCERRIQNVAELAEALLPFASPDAQVSAKRIRGVLIGSDTIAAETCFMPLGSLVGKPEVPEAGRPAGGAASALDAPTAVEAAAGRPAGDAASALNAPNAVNIAPAALGAASPGVGPMFRRAPKRSNRGLLVVAGSSAAVLALAGVTAGYWYVGSEAQTPAMTLQTVAVPVTEAVARVVAENEAAAAPGGLPGAAASAPAAAVGSPDEPDLPEAAPASVPAPQAAAAPSAAVASTTAVKPATVSTRAKAVTRKSVIPVAPKASAIPTKTTKTSRTPPKPAPLKAPAKH